MAFHSPLVAFIFLLVALFIAPFASSIPFIVLHGIGDECKSSYTQRFTELLSAFSGSPGYCVEVGNGILDSWTLSMETHVEVVCGKVKQMKELSNGFNIVGLSQGNLIGRGVVEFCDGAPPVKNFISLAGPQAGTASIPLCVNLIVCFFVNTLLKGAIYSEFAQDHLTPAGYIKLPNDIPGYLKGCKFLPKLNNELPDQRNATYKERFTSLQNLLLVQFEGDLVLVPKETAWFSYYADGSLTTILPVEQTKLYIEDWIGLRTLNEAGRVRFLSLKGGHYGTLMSTSDMQEYIVPYLVDEKLKEGNTKAKVLGLGRRIAPDQQKELVISGLSDITSSEEILEGSSYQ